jgi:hypothetical protein
MDLKPLITNFLISILENNQENVSQNEFNDIIEHALSLADLVNDNKQKGKELCSKLLDNAKDKFGSMIVCGMMEARIIANYNLVKYELTRMVYQYFIPIVQELFPEDIIDFKEGWNSTASKLNIFTL